MKFVTFLKNDFNNRTVKTIHKITQDGAHQNVKKLEG